MNYLQSHVYIILILTLSATAYSVELRQEKQTIASAAVKSMVAEKGLVDSAEVNSNAFDRAGSFKSNGVLHECRNSNYTPLIGLKSIRLCLQNSLVDAMVGNWSVGNDYSAICTAHFFGVDGDQLDSDGFVSVSVLDGEFCLFAEKSPPYIMIDYDVDEKIAHIELSDTDSGVGDCGNHQPAFYFQEQGHYCRRRSDDADWEVGQQIAIMMWLDGLTLEIPSSVSIPSNQLTTESDNDVLKINVGPGLSSFR